MFNFKSDYALNKKDPDAIVCVSVTGRITRLTRESFSSEAEFLRWKAWSDESYHGIEKADHIEANHTLSLYGLSEMAVAVLSPEDVLATADNLQERQQLRHLLMEGLDTCLTPTQRRRLWLHCVDGLTVRQIATAENAAFQNVARSISVAKKKLLKLLKKQDDKTLFQRR